MNNYRLSTFRDKNNNPVTLPPLSPVLIDQVLNLQDTYIIGQNSGGLRINASKGILVKNQLFYVFAEGTNGEKLVFKSTQTCREFFALSRYTVLDRLATNSKFSFNNIEYKLSRKVF